MNLKKQKNNNGFTLIEMLVSVALFTIVLTIAIGAILTIIDANRKSQTLTLVMNNLNFAMESMTRSIKTANPSNTGDDRIRVDGGNTKLTLTDQEGRRIIYEFDEDAEKITKEVDSGTEVPIVSDDVVIEDAKFYLSSSYESSGYNKQPRIHILIYGYVQITEKTRSDFSIQTTISPRQLNIDAIN